MRWALIGTLWLNEWDNGTGTNTGFELVGFVFELNGNVRVSRRDILPGHSPVRYIYGALHLLCDSLDVVCSRLSSASASASAERRFTSIDSCVQTDVRSLDIRFLLQLV